MIRFDWRWLVVSSVMVGAVAARAGTRPQYGGTVRVAMRAAPMSLDPAELGSGGVVPADSFARRSLTMLMFDTLVMMDEHGRVQRWLAESWQASQGNQRWQLRIRRDVKFHDGTPLSAEVAAASLRAANPTWNVRAEGDSVVIEPGGPDPELLAELALPRNAIVKRNPDSTPSGTGPFHVVDWQPGKKLTLAPDEDCWRGRPLLDSIEIEMGKSFREQMTALELGKASLVEASPEQTHQFSQYESSQYQSSQHRDSQAGRRLANSAPVELLALLFAREVMSPDEKLLREALALSVERGSIKSVLLQGAGQPAASILPNWMSGYGFVFSVGADLARARQAREQVPTVPTWTIGYDSADPVDRLLAERIALNAKDAGLSLQPTVAATADLRLVRIPLASTDPWIALASVATLAGTSAGKAGGSVEELYASELAVLATQRVIPLFHLPVSYAALGTLRNWALRPDGSWTLADAWLGTGKP
ncbi:MAG TPA: ABC transporter substrate-binding protein [Candidatus Sulfotelmatobacter sp.]|nr:ABC transporter substrate-binding protein [Candidatus Sulfotelmatobacter sp.]